MKHVFPSLTSIKLFIVGVSYIQCKSRTKKLKCLHYINVLVSVKRKFNSRNNIPVDVSIFVPCSFAKNVSFPLVEM